MPTFTGDAADAIASGNVRLGIFFRLASDPVTRFWSGPGDYLMPVDAVEIAPATYRGDGTLAPLPGLSQLINGVAERVDIALSGVAAALVSAFDGDPEALCFRELRIGIVVLDADWQPISDTAWLWTGASDGPEYEGADNERTISLSAASVWTGRRRPPFSFWTDADQQRRSPGDRFCERTSKYQREVIMAWPVV